MHPVAKLQNLTIRNSPNVYPDDFLRCGCYTSHPREKLLIYGIVNARNKYRRKSLTEKTACMLSSEKQGWLRLIYFELNTSHTPVTIYMSNILMITQLKATGK